jgi:pimeloyl-ACP methyl ester carboxylesterase
MQIGDGAAARRTQRALPAWRPPSLSRSCGARHAVTGLSTDLGRIRLTLVTAAMIELDDGAQLRTWTAGWVIPQRLPVVMVHGGGAMIIGGAGDTRPADALRRLGARLNCEVVIVADAGHNPWLEAPGQFGAALRAAVQRQTPGR